MIVNRLHEDGGVAGRVRAGARGASAASARRMRAAVPLGGAARAQSQPAAPSVHREDRAAAVTFLALTFIFIGTLADTIIATQ